MTDAVFKPMSLTDRQRAVGAPSHLIEHARQLAAPGERAAPHATTTSTGHSPATNSAHGMSPAHPDAHGVSGPHPMMQRRGIAGLLTHPVVMVGIAAVVIWAVFIRKV